MSNSNERKSRALGIPFGTACNRLRKNILFRLLQQSNQDVCFKCSTKIEAVDDLSIEHKQPWEGRDVALFWDLENIAFSHLHCNRPHNPPPNKKYFTEEDRLIATREQNARCMRNNYSTEKRREKFKTTGH